MSTVLKVWYIYLCKSLSLYKNLNSSLYNASICFDNTPFSVIFTGSLVVMALFSLNLLPSSFYHPKLPAISKLIFIQIKIALICSNDYKFPHNL